MFYLIAQAAPVVPDPTGISALSNAFESAGPYAIAAVTAMGLWVLWRYHTRREAEHRTELTAVRTEIAAMVAAHKDETKRMHDEYRGEIARMNAEFMAVIREQGKMLAESVGAMREVRDTVAGCPRRS